jgi:serine phosphatase RsbU (regulator of sigma subunit)
MIYAVIDGANGTVTLANAGHYPPFLVRADGAVDVAETPPRRLLGADPDNCLETQFPFAPGDTLLLVTDGLFERRGEHVDIGLARVRSAAAALAGPDLPAALASVVAEVHNLDGDDDVTALAVRGA